MSHLNQHYLNQDNNTNAYIRQNLINQPPPHQEQIPIQGVIPPPATNPVTLYNTLINVQMQQPPVPHVPISQYKLSLEIWLLYGCLLEIIWRLEYSVIHFVWFVYFGVLGIYRHRTLSRKLRFWGEFINMLVWIGTLCYVFAGHRGTIFPFAIILQNLDYYFLGGQLASIYFTHLIYRTSNLYADIRLCIIRTQLQQRRDNYVYQLMHEFFRHEQNLQNSVQLKPIASGSQQFPQQSMIHEGNSCPQRQLNNQNNQTCFICKMVLVRPYLIVAELGVVRLIKCHHRFHYNCLKRFIQRGNFNCPICTVRFVE